MRGDVHAPYATLGGFMGCLGFIQRPSSSGRFTGQPSRRLGSSIPCAYILQCSFSVFPQRALILSSMPSDSRPPFVPIPFSPALPLPEYIQRVANAYLQRTVAFVLNDTGAHSDIHRTPITWEHFLSAVRHRAQFILEASGASPRELGQPQFTVALLAKNDYAYVVSLFAMIMLRWTVLLVSPRNPAPAIDRLLHSVDCRVLFVDDGFQTLLTDLSESSYRIVHIGRDESFSPNSRLNSIQIPQEHVHADEDTQSLQEEAQQPFVYLHTSGSTGHPKIVPWTHTNALAACEALHHSRISSMGKIVYSPLPLFHVAGLFMMLTTLFSQGGASTFFETHHHPSATSTVRHLRHFPLEEVDLFLAPSIVEDILDGEYREEGLKIFKAVHILLFAGAPLRKDAGDALCGAGVRLVPGYGMTELGPITTFAYDAASIEADWAYMRFAESQYRFHFRPVDAHGTVKELIQPGKGEPCVFNHQSPRGFATNDLWIQHPDPAKKGWWRHMGRMDDVTVLSNGEKTDNKALQHLLCQHPSIAHAVVFGTGRSSNGVILKPSTPLQSHTPLLIASYIDSIWPHITHEVNPALPQHSRLLRPLVLVEDPAKPFPFTDKGTLRTKLVLDAYRDEIDEAYRALETSASDALGVSIPPSGLTDDLSELTTHIRAIATRVLSVDTIEDERDLFEAGLDSLLAIQVRAALVHALKRSACTCAVPRNVVYAHPSVSALARYLRTALRGSTGLAGTELEPEVGSAELVESMIAEFSQGFPPTGNMGTESSSRRAVYAITGTTGSLGSHFLSDVLKRQDVDKIYLLARTSTSGSPADRHETVFREKGLDYAVLAEAIASGRVVLLEVDLGKEHLGLTWDTYDQLCREATHIVHIAWHLNFNLHLHAFRPYLAGLRNIIDLALFNSASLVFLSSISAASARSGCIPEAALDAPTDALEQGYAQSKYAAEKILEAAARKGLRASVVRVGQLSGDSKDGRWTQTEYIPILFRSCLMMRAVPEGLADVRWLPVDIAARALCEIVAAPRDANAYPALAFYNLQNALTTPWLQVVHAVKEYDARIQPVGADEWLRLAEQGANVPAAKLLEFYENIFRTGTEGRKEMEMEMEMEMTRTREAVGDLVECVVEEEVIRRYVERACENLEC
ncbi:acetyl-CoA synthetase-like protein [Dentipellis sp. KUC8613]|nr:acetyl-CoA synthetase-like protein [Dentipellis sp. KUC8613]